MTVGYSKIMKHKLELNQGFSSNKRQIVDLIPQEDGTWQVVTRMNAVYTAKAVILATVLFSGGRIYVGDISYYSPGWNVPSSISRGESLKKLGLRLRRFKLEPRCCCVQHRFFSVRGAVGDDPVVPFVLYTEYHRKLGILLCGLDWNQEAETDYVRIFTVPHVGPGQIEGVGPRYCPSIEDKNRPFCG